MMRLVVLALLALMSSSVRKRPSAAPPKDTELVHRSLVQCGTKTGITEAISVLSEAGWLRPEVLQANARATRRRLREAEVSHCDADTPYGKVVQSLDLLPTFTWRFCHPMALLYYLCTISATFAELMWSCVAEGVVMNIILYIDEFCPGNPLRPEKSRTLQAIYWCCSNWPQHILQRTGAWPCFGTIRSRIADAVPGGVAGLMRRILMVFFQRTGRRLHGA